MLPTPEARLAISGFDAGRASRPRSGSLDLTTTVVLLPTPTTQDGANNGGPSQFKRNTPPLNTRVLMLPTPRAADSKAGGDGPVARSRVASGIATLGETVAVKAEGVQDWQDYEPAIRRWEAVMGPAPLPTEISAKGKRVLSARFAEWMMGQPAGWVTDPAIGISRGEQIKACGNGVVTQQAAFALADMLESMGEAA